jgi:drug/metabolite transporter (DMT)-like permease
MSPKKVYLMMTVSAWFWAGAFIAAKYCAPQIPVFALVFLRFSIAALILGPALSALPIEEKYKLRKKDYLPQMILGTFGMFGYHVLFFAAVHYTTAVNASILAGVNPLLTVIFGAVYFRQYITKQMLAGIILSLAGVFFTITGMSLNVIKTLDFNKGDLLMLIALLLWCSYIVLSRECGVPPVRFTLNNFYIAAALSFPLLIMENPLSWITETTPAAWFAVVYMAACPTVFSYCALQISSRAIGAQRAAVFFNFVPAFSMLLAVLILKETFEIIKVFTMFLIIAGVVICQFPGKRAL